MKVARLFSGLILVLVLLTQTGVIAQNNNNNPSPEPIKKVQGEGWIVLKAYVETQSRKVFQKMIKGHPFRVVSMPEEEEILKRLANRMSHAAGNGDYNQPIKIVSLGFRKNVINALTFPGGQMLFFTGLFTAFKVRAREMAEEKTALNKKLGKQDAIDYHYERLIGAVLGHEMGHYVGQHFMRRYTFTAQQLQNQNFNLPMEQIRFGQEHELEADEFGLQVMASIGFEPHYAMEVLKILKEVQQKRKRRGANINPYMTSHPTGNTRIANVARKSKDAEYFERLSRIEFAMAAIETGVDLDQAADTLDSELKRSPKNPHLLSAAAKVYHRLWESSCTLDDLVFKSSITGATFYDEMVVKKANLRSMSAPVNKTPGNRAFYFKAEKYYRQAIAKNADFMTQSSFAVLLAYNPSKREEAVRRAELAAENMKKASRTAKYRTLNNLGIVYFFVKDNHNAEKAFQKSSRWTRRLFKSRPFRKTSYMKRQQLMQGLSKRNTGNLFEALFNLGQLYQRTGFEKQAKTVWTNYVTHLDWNSAWAKYAALQINLDISKVRPGPVPNVAGVRPGSSIPHVIQAWGKPTKESPGYQGRTKWLFPERGAEIQLELGIVKVLRIRGPKSRAVSNGVSVNMSRAAVEKKLGRPPSERGHRVFYPRRHMMLDYTDDKVVQIYLMK